MKYFITILILFFTFFIAFSQEAQIGEAQKESALLWKINGPNVKPNSYLFGTMHLIEKEYFIFPKKLQKRVKKSDLLVMELSGTPNQMEIMKYVQIKDGSFFDYFNQQQTDSIFVWAKEKFGMEEEAFRSSFSKMKPFVVTQLGVQLHFIGKTESYEVSLEEIAKSNDIKIKGLETIEDQMTLLNSLTKDQQAEMLMETIRNGNKGIEQVKKMEQVYANQDVHALYKMIQDEGGVIKEEQQQFLDQRNENWIPQIKDFIQANSTFIAVGAGHLGGPKGVIKLLEKEGYTLTPIKL